MKITSYRDRIVQLRTRFNAWWLATEVADTPSYRPKLYQAALFCRIL